MCTYSHLLLLTYTITECCTFSESFKREKKTLEIFIVLYQKLEKKNVLFHINDFGKKSTSLEKCIIFIQILRKTYHFISTYEGKKRIITYPYIKKISYNSIPTPKEKEKKMICLS